MSSDLFGIESARAPAAEKWLTERKELLQKSTLTPEEKSRLGELNDIAQELPTAVDAKDIAAMEIIRKAAEYLKHNKSKALND